MAPKKPDPVYDFIYIPAKDRLEKETDPSQMRRSARYNLKTVDIGRLFSGKEASKKLKSAYLSFMKAKPDTPHSGHYDTSIIYETPAGTLFGSDPADDLKWHSRNLRFLLKNSGRDVTDFEDSEIKIESAEMYHVKNNEMRIEDIFRKAEEGDDVCSAVSSMINEFGILYPANDPVNFSDYKSMVFDGRRNSFLWQGYIFFGNESTAHTRKERLEKTDRIIYQTR